MRDLIRFVWRGALGGAILPSLFGVYFLWVSFGTPFFFWYALIISPSLAIPGAIVGAGLWVCALFVERVGLLLRVTIGMAITSAPLALGYLASTDLNQDSQFFRRLIFGSVYQLAVGGIAGWICPATTIFRKEPEPRYWERVREYEEAQAEHDHWKAQLALGKSEADKRPV